MKKNVQISFAIIFLILGIVIAIQFKSTEKNKKITEVDSKSVQDVQAQLIRQKEYSESLQGQISEYQKKLENYEKNVNVSEIIKQDLERARTLAGLNDVKGKGIVITIDDTKVANNFKIIDPNSSDVYLVTDVNLLELVNELRAAGVEAISINDERITSATEIRLAGSYMRINNKNTNRPFTIKAIGNPDTIDGSLKLRDGILDYLMSRGFDVTIKKDDNVKIAKYSGVLNFSNLNKE